MDSQPPIISPPIVEPPVISPQPQPIYFVQQTPRSNTGIVLVFSLLLLIGLVVGIGLWIDSERSPIPAAAVVPEKPLPANPHDIAELSVGLTDWTWSHSMYGDSAGAHFVVTNGSRFDIKDLVIACVEYGHSGTPISTNQFVLYEIVPAGQTRSFNGISIGYLDPQASTVGAFVADFTVKQ